MIVPNTVKLYWTNWGAGLSLAGAGPKEDIEKIFNTLYNNGGIEDKPDNEIAWLSDHKENAFGYVLTDKKRLIQGFANAHVTQLTQEKIDEPRESRRGIWDEAEKRAREDLDKIVHEEFLKPGRANQEYEAPKIPKTED